MKKILFVLVILSLLLISVNLANSKDVILEMKISEAADVRKSDSQGTAGDINALIYNEQGHGDPNSPVRVESWRTTLFSFYDSNLDGDWYSNDIGNYAFGWRYLGSTLGWSFTDFNPDDIENGIYDADGTNPTLKDEEDNYLFIGNHTRFHVATNYRPYVNFEAPEYLLNGDSRISVKQIQIGWNTNRYAIIPGGESETLDCLMCQCSPGNYSTNQFAIFAVIEMPKEWWTLETGEYSGTAVLTLTSP